MTINPFEALRHAFFSVFRNMGAAFGISWPWLIVLGVVFAVLGVVVFQSGFGQTPLDPNAGAGSFILAVLIGLFIYLVAFCSIAVNWHRYVLLDDVPYGNTRLRVDGHVWRYLWRAVLAGLLTLAIVAVPLGIGAAIFQSAFPDPAIWPANVIRYAIEGVASALVGALFFRSALALPAAAVGRVEIGIGESWRRTKGNMLPLVIIAAGSWLLQIAVQLIMAGASLVLAAAGSAVGLSLLVAIGVLLTWYVTFFSITLLTSLYGFFVENRPL